MNRIISAKFNSGKKNFITFKSLVSNKTPANDVLNKVFYKAFLNQLKDPLFKIILSGENF